MKKKDIKRLVRNTSAFLFALLFSYNLKAQVVLENEVNISNNGLYFNGQLIDRNLSTNNENTDSYDFIFGSQISATPGGDGIETYGNYVFLTWYKGGKMERNVMLTRYNTITGAKATIEFPHRHTGYLNQWWLGESHNYISVAVSPLDGTIHLLYDMHAYSRTRPTDGSFSNDYFRYSYSVKNAASLPDAEFTLDKFVEKPGAPGVYRHLSLNSGKPGYAIEDYGTYAALTYPQFFLNDAGELFMNMREGGNNNGAYKFTKYDATTSTWSSFTHFNLLNAKNKPDITYNWGLYGTLKYVNGKFRIGFQRRSANNDDKYIYQNGVYYAYSDDQDGFTDWKDHSGTPFSLPLFDADKIKVMEPGDYVQTTQANKVYIVGGFDWTVTANGDVHIISKVKDNENNVTKYLHTYKPAGTTNFITTDNFESAQAIYTSGDSVFLIGLKNNRVFIKKAEGGTNNFTTVYQATSGKRFSHGRVHIDNGKLYYHLMEQGTGSARALYLQIIDLDIVKNPFRVSLTSPDVNQVYFVDESIQVKADAVDENGSISKVEFLVNGLSIGEAVNAPYLMVWLPDTEGAYTIQAVAYNANNETVTALTTVNVKVFNPNDLTGSIYRIKNFATGMYLDAEGSDVIASASGIGTDKEWRIIEAGNFYNILSDRGVLRNAPGGDIINTAFPAPDTTVDKTWAVIYNEEDGTYRFKAELNVRYLRHSANGLIDYSEVLDDRSKWIVESALLSVDDQVKVSASIRVYPNPAEERFTISFRGINNAKVKIFNMLGKMVFEESTSYQSIVINNNNRFQSGLYLVRVEADNHKVLITKLIVK